MHRFYIDRYSIEYEFLYCGNYISIVYCPWHLKNNMVTVFEFVSDKVVLTKIKTPTCFHSAVNIIYKILPKDRQ